MKSIKDNEIREPENKFMGGVLWQWKEPIEGHKYIMGMDVSRGDSEDFTTFTIIDFDEREQVLEYLAKVPPDVVAEIVLALNPAVNSVDPVTVPPLKGKKSPTTELPPLKVTPVTLKVPPVLFVNVIVPAEYVPPVTKTSVFPVKPLIKYVWKSDIYVWTVSPVAALKYVTKGTRVFPEILPPLIYGNSEIFLFAIYFIL